MGTIKKDALTIALEKAYKASGDTFVAVDAARLEALTDCKKLAKEIEQQAEHIRTLNNKLRDCYGLENDSLDAEELTEVLKEAVQVYGCRKVINAILTIQK